MPSFVAVNAAMSWAPVVTVSIRPFAMRTRFRFELPFSAETTSSDDRSFDQTTGFRFWPRGAT